MRLASLIILALLLGAPMVSARPVNVLFILSDNQPAAIIGAYGNPEVRTPHIDRLAREGMRFTSAFAVNGMCSPTRATLMTGLMPSQHGVHNWLDDTMLEEWPRDWSAIAEYRTLPLTLANRGYNTAMIGKWHLGQPWKPAAGFQHWVTFADGHTVDFWNNRVIENDRSYVVNDRHLVDFFAAKAVEYLENYDSDKPFYLQLNLNGPYMNPPTNLGPARNRHYQSYIDGSFSSFPRVAWNANLALQLTDPETPPFLIEKHLQSAAMHNDPATMANVASQNTVVDDAVGAVMDALKAKGLDETTLVIYSSDQGNFFGQHGLWQHTVVTLPSNLYEAAMNVPLIIRQPGSVPSDSVNQHLIAQYDLPVTVLDYLGIDKKFQGSPGRSFAGQLRGEEGDWEELIFYEQEETRGIRTPQFAYWKRLQGTGVPELYHMSDDPGQHHNLAQDPAYGDVIARLDKQMSAFYGQYSDPRYDLWRGGTAKGSVIRPEMFRKLYGSEWRPHTDVVEPFTE